MRNTAPHLRVSALADKRGSCATDLGHAQNPAGIGSHVIVPCFTPGTLIATLKGQRLVQDLTVDDAVLTRDNGYQPVRWIGSRDIDIHSTGSSQMGHLQPILIRAGALGTGVPDHDLVVSPQHRMLLTRQSGLLDDGTHEVLVAARDLIGHPGVCVAPRRRVRFMHLLFDRHEIILADGAWSESYQPADPSLAGLGGPQRQEVEALFPELRSDENLFPAARQSIVPGELAERFR